MEFYRYLLRSVDGGDCWMSEVVHVQPLTRFISQSEKTRLSRIYVRKPRVLSQADIGLLLGQLRSPHDLIFKWTLCTGLRRSTIIALQMNQVAAANGTPFSVLEFQSKGGKFVDVLATSELIRETRRYIETRRVVWLRGGEQQRVFVGSSGAPTSSAAYYHAFRRAALAAGVKAHPHMARHTFAVRVNEVAKQMLLRGKNIAPDKLTQRLLGHSSSSTTAIYLDSIGAATGDALGILSQIQEEFLQA